MNKLLCITLCANLLFSTLRADLITLPDGTCVPKENVESVVKLVYQLSSDQQHADHQRALRARITLHELYDNAQLGSPLLPGIRDPFVQAQWANEDGYVTASIRSIIKVVLTIQGRAIYIKTTDDIMRMSPQTVNENAE